MLQDRLRKVWLQIVDPEEQPAHVIGWIERKAIRPAMREVGGINLQIDRGRRVSDISLAEHAGRAARRVAQVRERQRLIIDRISTCGQLDGPMEKSGEVRR